MSQRHAVTKKLAAAYKQGSRVDKTRMLDELVGLTDWHRDHARAALRTAGTLRVTRPRVPSRAEAKSVDNFLTSPDVNRLALRSSSVLQVRRWNRTNRGMPVTTVH